MSIWIYKLFQLDLNLTGKLNLLFYFLQVMKIQENPVCNRQYIVFHTKELLFHKWSSSCLKVVSWHGDGS